MGLFRKSRLLKILLIVSAILLVMLAAVSVVNRGHASKEAANRTKVMLIGLDALEWDILNPLIAEGKLPNFEKLINNGTSGHILSGGETESPILWTTIATGKLKDQHGIQGYFSTGDDDPKHIPYTSADRKVAALWNIIGMEDRDVACFGWWCTWPAEKVNGVMVSACAPWDPVQYFRRGLSTDKNTQSQLTYPASLYNKIKPEIVSDKSVTWADLQRFVNMDNPNDPVFESKRVEPCVNYVLPWSIATDRSYVQIAEDLLGKKKYDLSMIYIQGTDTTAHKFWAFREGGKTLHNILTTYDLHPENQATYEKYFGHVIDNYYIYADELVGRLLAKADNKTVVIITSDHGFGPSTTPLEGRWEGHTFSGDHRERGTVIMSGPGIRKGKKLSEDNPPHVYDITPTVLAILGLPLANDMVGEPIMDAFDPMFLEDYHPTMVQSYDVDFKKGERPESIQMSAEYTERMRSLGYIQ
jgi:predicted AlkP superfamily phosphohydrolase/phosphomutase